MRHLLLIASALLCGCTRSAAPDARETDAQAKTQAAAQASAAPRPAAAPDKAALVRGELPTGPESEALQARCQVCHSLEYVTQQRLTEAQWDKTLTKMQKWGALVTDDEKKQLAPYLAAVWQKDLAERVSPRVPTPAGAVPAHEAGAR